MSDAVIDSSVAAKWYLPEPDALDAARVVADVNRFGGRLIVIDLVYVEVANAIWRRRYMGHGTDDDARRLLQKLQASQLQVEAAQLLLTPALDIGMKYAIAIYDALFVALVQDINLPGVTADVPLHRAVQAEFSCRWYLRRPWPCGHWRRQGVRSRRTS